MFFLCLAVSLIPNLATPAVSPNAKQEQFEQRRKGMTNARPFRFGAVADSAQSREEWVALARQAEGLGYATFLLADHYVNEFPPIAALMAAADATSTLRIGSFVFDN